MAKDNQVKIYKNRAKEYNPGSSNRNKEQVLRIHHQNICGLGSKTNGLLISLYPSLPHIVCLTEHHLSQFQLQLITLDNYILGAEFSRQSFLKGGGLHLYTETFTIYNN